MRKKKKLVSFPSAGVTPELKIWGASRNERGIISPPPLIELGLTDLSKTGGGDCPPAIPLPASLLLQQLERRQQVVGVTPLLSNVDLDKLLHA